MQNLLFFRLFLFLPAAVFSEALSVIGDLLNSVVDVLAKTVENLIQTAAQALTDLVGLSSDTLDRCMCS